MKYRFGLISAPLVFVLTIVLGASGAAASTATPTPASIFGGDCPRAARTTPVVDWIETPGPVGTPVIAATVSGEQTKGRSRLPQVALADLPAGPDASAETRTAIVQLYNEIASCLIQPSDQVDAYFSDDFFRRAVVVQHLTPVAANGAKVGYAWGIEGFDVTGNPPELLHAWTLPNGRIIAILKSRPNAVPLILILVKSTSGELLIDQLAYLKDATATPST